MHCVYRVVLMMFLNLNAFNILRVLNQSLLSYVSCAYILMYKMTKDQLYTGPEHRTNQINAIFTGY